MKWDYKVVTIDQLFHGSDDHDIAISKDAAAARRNKQGQGVEGTLNKMGDESWELVTLAGDFAIFKRPKDKA
ncbi:MAG: hypothetical protein AB7I96_07645 [Candidatus Dadabacteria bacterium]